MVSSTISNICIDCQETFNPRRAAFGYRTCLECGESRAQIEIKRKAKCTAPAYNKGAYQYVGTKQVALGVGK